MIEVSHRELVELGAKWLNKKAPNIHYKSQFVCAELVCLGASEIPDIFGLRPQGHVLIEVKVSRQDFLKDKKKMGRNPERLQLGNMRLYLAPEGLISVDELPDNWGLLEYDGKDIKIIHHSKWVKCCPISTGYVYHSIMRRLLKPQVFDFRKPNEIETDQSLSEFDQNLKTALNHIK